MILSRRWLAVCIVVAAFFCLFRGLLCHSIVFSVLTFFGDDDETERREQTKSKNCNYLAVCAFHLHLNSTKLSNEIKENFRYVYLISREIHFHNPHANSAVRAYVMKSYFIVDQMKFRYCHRAKLWTRKCYADETFCVLQKVLSFHRSKQSHSKALKKNTEINFEVN